MVWLERLHNIGAACSAAEMLQRLRCRSANARGLLKRSKSASANDNVPLRLAAKEHARGLLGLACFIFARYLAAQAAALFPRTNMAELYPTVLGVSIHHGLGGRPLWLVVTSERK
jgi:hypothetical protein